MNMVFRSVKDTIIYTGQHYFDNEFNLDDPLRLLNYRKTFNCLIGSDQCPQLGINPEKGVLIQGNKGVGKSILMKVMRKLFKDTDRRFQYVRALDIIDLMRVDKITEPEIKELFGRVLKCDLCIDDLGFGENERNRFGSFVNILSEIIYERDELWVEEGYLTHYTTNLRTNKPKEGEKWEASLEEQFGDRVFDRMKQHTNLITWKGASLRK